MNKIVERIEQEVGLPGLAAVLAQRLTPTDLQSLLLEVYRLRSNQLLPAAILSNYESNRFVRPSAVSATQFLKWEQIALSQLPQEFETLVLSPVCPLGTNSVVASIDQNWAVATVRNTEVVSDSTNVLALECAVRRRQLLRSNPRSTEPVHLATSHRLLRAQHFQGPQLLSHFSAFALCSAGRDQGRSQFELSTLGTHIRFYLRALRAFLGPAVPLQVAVSDFQQPARDDVLETQLLSSLRSEFENVECLIDDQRTRGRGYYLDFCFMIHASASSGQRLNLVDGGSINWTQQYLGSAKERLITSGLGSERLCQEFAT
ncbi:hypothetical protein TFLX_02709 [Thermoflexales bacterium]|nr:hypothetical protein TFLX_02709 [Thermoflexales bacterium]